MKFRKVTPARAGVSHLYLAWSADHSAASGTSKNHRSSHGNLRLVADARMRRSSALSGDSAPASHFETVPCDTCAMAAISTWVMRNTHFRMWASGLIMPEPYSKSNYSSRHEHSDAHAGLRYVDPMSSDAIEIISELVAITQIDQARLAKIAGVSQSTISKWLNGTHHPSQPAWDRIMHFAAGRPETLHLAHRYVFSLLGRKPDNLTALMTAAFAHSGAARPDAFSGEVDPDPRPRRKRRVRRSPLAKAS